MLRQRVIDAVAKRRAAGLPSAQTNAWRAIHDIWDELDGVTCDVLDDTAVLRLREPRWLDRAALDGLIDGLVASGVNGVHPVWDRPRKHDDARVDPWSEAPEQLRAHVADRGLVPPNDRFTIRENGRSFEVALSEGFSQGLFLDMRQPRADLAQRWEGRRVANLFAYTCGFGVCLAGRNDVTNVDVSRKYLDWGRTNYGLNGLCTDKGFVVADAFEFLATAQKRGHRWDGIVLDPPSFSRGKAGKARAFSLRDDLEGLIDTALAVLSDDGELFVSTNLASLAPSGFSALVRRAAAARRRRVIQTWPPAADFPAPAGDFHLKTALISR